ncbi:hypothetical protein [Alicyclobacillus macrosporangiidus]|uniref:hypothetical protein n=1 Tax=Alicyclobacillus macrosporangiidus TaxID=392015 RepID=UPI000A81AB03|nr:hypothetical protein [Alicyclobacillus macrosporangiidus]
MNVYFDDPDLRQKIIELLTKARLTTRQALQVLDRAKEDILDLNLPDKSPKFD